MGKKTKIILYNENCLDVLPKVKNKSIQMILADLPYGITQNKWDIPIPIDKLWPHYWRILKDNGCIVLTATQPFTSFLVMNDLKNFKYSWKWDKMNVKTNFLNAKKQPLRETEDILVFYKAQCIYNPQMSQGIPYNSTTSANTKNYGKQRKIKTVNENGLNYPSELLHFKQQDGKRTHPTQKPIKLFSYLIRTYTNENDWVLDNCFGRGTTAFSCIEENRNFIGMENDSKEGYFQYCIEECEKYKNEKNYNLDIRY